MYGSSDHTDAGAPPDQEPESKQMTKFTVFANVETQEVVSTHRTLKAAGKAYQKSHTGNLRRVIDAKGNDVTMAACDAANGY